MLQPKPWPLSDRKRGRMRKASLGEGIICFVGICGLQAGLNWMNQASNANLRWVLLGALVALIVFLWITRRQHGNHRG